MLDRILNMLKKEREQRLTALLTGACSDYTQYRMVLAEYKILDRMMEDIPRLVIADEVEE